MHPDRPISATIDRLAWLAGRWVGGDGDDWHEETWSEPRDGTMLGMFRAHREGQPRFYEIFSVAPEDGTLVLRIKHFRPGLIGWEERDSAVTLDLVAASEIEAIYAKRGAGEWLCYRRDPATASLAVSFEAGDGSHDPADDFRFVRG